jgi:hypothetical protein
VFSNRLLLIPLYTPQNKRIGSTLFVPIATSLWAGITS